MLFGVCALNAFCFAACDDMLAAQKDLWEKYRGKMSIVGSAAAGGWDLDQAVVMDERGGVFVWTGTLAEGEVKFAWQKPDFSSGTWYMARSQGERVSWDWAPGAAARVFPAVYIARGGADNNWQVDAGDYRVTVDRAERSAAFSPLLHEVYILGDATPGGWDLDALSDCRMIRDADGIFSWTGELTADGDLKCICKKKSGDSLDFGSSPQFLAREADTPLEDGMALPVVYAASTPEDAADFKFKTGSAGRWTITLDPDALTLSAAARSLP
jgi:hypothetical protein